jgi:hypothetical protein
MSSTHLLTKSLRITSSALILVLCSTLVGSSTRKDYAPKNADELEVLSLVIKAEVQANNWTKDDLICLYVEDKDPNKRLVKTLQMRGLNVCRVERHTRFECGFQLSLNFNRSDSHQLIRVHSVVGDSREINQGLAHIATLLRDGEYSVRQTSGIWSVSGYAPTYTPSK